jgi:hypothetical protein
MVTMLLLSVGLSVAPSASAACLLNHQDWLLVPTLSPQPPAFSSPTLNRVTVYFYDGIIPGVSFELRSVAPPVCAGGACSPDFNVIFQKHGSGFFADQVGPTFNTPGPDSGVVPLGAQWALIWMRYGPDFPNNDGSPALALFNFGQIC